MASFTVPYTSAMRLGMGYNTFTHELCVNDAVQKLNGQKASEKDLRALKDPASSTAADQSAVLSKSAGSMTRALPDLQKDISQNVKWEASFVDSLTDAFDKAEISGSLAIKLDAFPASVEANGKYVNTTAIKKSDVTYMITVDVINQKLVADDVTQFVPIENITNEQFTKVYGDSFISGFVEGGSFTATISITLEDNSKTMSLGGGLKAQIPIQGVANVSAEVKGGLDKTEKTTSAKTAISVSYTGGGDIRKDDVDEWTIATLKKVAVAFPDAVAACPQRKSAIITKYTALRSFYEMTTLGSPLDYENAGVYSSSLMEAYMDYKMIFGELHQLLEDIKPMPRPAIAGVSASSAPQQGAQEGAVAIVVGKEVKPLKVLYKVEESTDLVSYRTQLEEDWKKRKETFDKRLASIAAQSASKSSLQLAIEGSKKLAAAEEEPPAPLNALKSYDANVFGLEKARRDCRMEMIKIVKEVDAVSLDPKVATDASRATMYLPPSVFRMLIPSTALYDDIIKKKDAEIAKIQQDLAASKKIEEEARSEAEREKKEAEKYADEAAANKTLAEQAEARAVAEEKARKSAESQLEAAREVKKQLDRLDTLATTTDVSSLAKLLQTSAPTSNLSDLRTSLQSDRAAELDKVKQELKAAIVGTGAGSEASVPKLNIVAAVYGLSAVDRDLQARIDTKRQRLQISPSELKTLADDHNWPQRDTLGRTLSVIYRWDDGPMSICVESVMDGDKDIVIDRLVSNHDIVRPTEWDSNSWSIVAAVWGKKSSSADLITGIVDTIKKNYDGGKGERKYYGSNAIFTDTFPTKIKTLVLFYQASKDGPVAAAVHIEGDVTRPAVLQEKGLLSNPQPTPATTLYPNPGKLDAATKALETKYRSVAGDFQITKCIGTTHTDRLTLQHPFDNLKDSKASKPTYVKVLHSGKGDISAWHIFYTDAKQVYDHADGYASTTWDAKLGYNANEQTTTYGSDGYNVLVLQPGEVINVVGIQTAKSSVHGIDVPAGIQMATSHDRTWEALPIDVKDFADRKKQKPFALQIAPPGHSFRSFYSVHGDIVDGMGVVWGRD